MIEQNRHDSSVKNSESRGGEGHLSEQEKGCHIVSDGSYDIEVHDPREFITGELIWSGCQRRLP